MKNNMQPDLRNMISLKTRYYHWIFAMLFIPALVGSVAAQAIGNTNPSHVETIVVIRHGEIPHGGLGQLRCKGLNRALALPKILIGRYGSPNFVFAPNPAVVMHEGGGVYSYVRPLATIEPTAIQAGLPVNALIGFNNVQALQKELTSPRYSDAVVFVAWEHIMAQRFSENMMRAFGGNADQVPAWKGSDYDSIYVLRLTRSGQKTTISFTHEHENLNHKLSKPCPLS